MRPLYDFVIELPKAFEDTVEIGGIQMFKDTVGTTFKVVFLTGLSRLSLQNGTSPRRFR